jgi:hypothetical protein
MAVQAMAPYHDGPRCHFVSNIDAAHVADVLRPLDPARTQVIVASKTFTTIETMTNAKTIKAWMGEAVSHPCRPVRGAVLCHRPHRRLRDRPGARLRLRGLGRRALFDVGTDRAVADDRHRPRRVPCLSCAARRTWTGISAPPHPKKAFQ